MEGWRPGGLEGWEGWKAGRLEGWRAGRLGGWRPRGWSLENSRANRLKGRNVFQALLPVVFFPGVLKLGGPEKMPTEVV